MISNLPVSNSARQLKTWAGNINGPCSTCLFSVPGSPESGRPASSRVRGAATGGRTSQCTARQHDAPGTNSPCCSGRRSLARLGAPSDPHRVARVGHRPPRLITSNLQPARLAVHEGTEDSQHGPAQGPATSGPLHPRQALGVEPKCCGGAVLRPCLCSFAVKVRAMDPQEATLALGAFANLFRSLLTNWTREGAA